MNYLLEFTVCITIFYGLYCLIFRRLTFIRLNRIYLLSSLIVGLSLPLISYQIKEVVKIPAGVEYEEMGSIPLVINSSTPLISNIPIEEPFNWNVILQGIYILGILFMLIKLIHSFRLIAKEIILKSSNHINHSSDNFYISTQSNYANSSFFHLIFIDDSNLSEHEINQILEHEKWHIRLFHSYDLLFVEILKIIFWFNPILWLYQRSLSEVHEYEVDTRMVQTYNPQNYAQLLLKLATTASPQFATTHQFSRKPLTDRIHFLFTKQKSVPMKRLAYLSVLPILGAFFMAFSVEKVIDYQEVEDSSKYIKIERKPDSQVNNEVSVKENNVISNLIYGDNRVALTMNPDKISMDAIVAASKYFKKIGFNLDVRSWDYHNSSKQLDKFEVILTEVNENKKKYRSKIKDEKSDLPFKFTFDLKKMKSEKLDDIITILADRSTGEHFVAVLAPPPPPPVPPKPPLPPKVPLVPSTPPKAPLKVGLRKDKKEDSKHQNYIIDETNKFKDINIANNNNSLGFQGKRINKNTFLSKIITQKDWQFFLDSVEKDDYFSNKSKRGLIPDNWSKIKVKSDKLPVQSVSFEQATEYCKWRTKLLNQDPLLVHRVGYPLSVYSKINFKLRLPTEKEWNTIIEKNVISPNNFGFRCILEMSVTDHKKTS